MCRVSCVVCCVLCVPAVCCVCLLCFVCALLAACACVVYPSARRFLRQVFSVIDGSLQAEKFINVARCMLAVAHCMAPFPSDALYGVGVAVGAGIVGSLPMGSVPWR